MSFHLTDLKKSVRKGREGYQITPTRLEGRSSAFRIEFLLQQFEGHVGCPRRMLDPNSLLEFVGDHRLGRGLLATLSQWYRMRARTFPELLADGGAALREHGITGPIDLRAWLYAAVNETGPGYLDPDSEALLWQRQARALSLRRQDLQRLMILDRPEEAVLVRTGPAPTAADVMAAYNARAHTTLLRSALEIGLRCDAGADILERAARTWANALDVEWRIEADTLKLAGRADALGCWTRHGRRVERVALELLSLPDLAVRELRGQVDASEKRCQFRWSTDTLTLLGAGRGAPLCKAMPDQVTMLAAALRQERERTGDTLWSIRRATHLVGVADGVFLPHLELRRGDLSLYLRAGAPDEGARASELLAPFAGKTPIALVSASESGKQACALRFASEELSESSAESLLSALAERADHFAERTVPSTARERRQPPRRAA